MDVTNKTTINSLLRRIDMPLIGLINNAGIGDFGTVEFQPEELLRKIMEVNFFGAFALTQSALPKIRQAQGRVVFVTSASGVIPGIPLFSQYQAPKHALEAMGNSWKQELAEHKVSVSFIEPGFLKSALMEAQWEHGSEVLVQSNNNPEKATYPEIMGPYLKKVLFLSTLTGQMEETCLAMEHALFAQYPKTRYLTSQIGPLPAWLFVRLLQLCPDRMADWLAARLEILEFVQGVRSHVESWLGYSTGDEL